VSDKEALYWHAASFAVPDIRQILAAIEDDFGARSASHFFRMQKAYSFKYNSFPDLRFFFNGANIKEWNLIWNWRI
jgi:hypothetical protein